LKCFSILCSFLLSAHRGDSHRYTSRESKALIKTLLSLVISQIDSVVKNLSCSLSGTRRICDSRTYDPFELFPSARYHIVTESTWLGIFYPMFGARWLLRGTVYYYEDGCHLTPNVEQKFNLGGADRDRTGDPLLAKQVLSQLSYSPLDRWWAWIDSNYRPHPYQGCPLAT
jgi:hypothetical protein